MGKTILVAVTDIGLSSLIRKSLEGSGYLVIQTNTVRAMVKVLVRKSIDLSLVDVKIYEQIKKTKGSRDYLQVPHVIIANLPDKNKAAEYVNQGALAYLLVDEGFSSSFTGQVIKLLSNQDKELRLPISDRLTKESEYLLKDILDTLKDPVYICSEHHSMQYANPVLKSLIGNRVQENKCYSAVFNSYKSCSECPSLSSLKEGSYTSQFQMLVNDETRYFQASITPIYFHNGSISRLNILKDVTDLIQTRIQAENNEKKFRLVAENAIDMVWQMDLRLKFTYLSPSAETILGYRMDEMLGRNLWEFTRKKYFIKMARYAMNAIKNYKTFDHITFESKLTHKNDNEVPVEITGKLLKDQKGKIIGLQGSTKDISERKTIENELVKSRHELSLRNRIANVFLTSDSDQLFQDILEILLEEFISPMGYFGYVNNKNELVCPSLSQKIKEESNLKARSTILPKSTWEGIWGQSLMEKRTLASNEKLTLPPGNTSVQNVICLPITIKEELLGQICLANKPGGYTEMDQKILENIADYIAPILHSYLEEVRLKKAQEEAFTLLKTAKEKAEESDQLKSAFLLNLSHELRTPLNAILGFTNILAEQVKDSEDGDLFTSQIAAAGKDLMKMIDDTIIMAKLESGQIEPDPVNQKLENTLLQIEDEFHKVYLQGNKDIEFQMVDKTNGILLNTDHQKLKSALNNLLDNAVKYSGKGSVELGAYKMNASNLIVYVKDNGIGISVENHKSIFEKFRKIEVKEKFYRGTGLGLAISKGLVDVIGGSIEIDSAPGEGTTVSISLPIDLDKKIA